MAQNTFAWTPDPDYSETTTPSVVEVSLGDGYEQRAPNGINPLKQSYDLVFSMREVAEAQAIEAFLRDAGGVDAFYYTPPDASVAVLVKCSEWRIDRDNPIHRTISCTFVRVFEP